MNQIKKVAVIMGSKSDLETMNHAIEILKVLGIEHDVKVVSAHRTPDRLYNFSKTADQSYCAVIAGAGGAAHLPGMVASMTWIPVFGVPVNATCLNGMDSLLSIAQMPGGIPVCTMSIGNSGAKNAGLAAGALISVFDEEVRARLIEFRDSQSEKVVESVE